MLIDEEALKRQLARQLLERAARMFLTEPTGLCGMLLTLQVLLEDPLTQTAIAKFLELPEAQEMRLLLTSELDRCPFFAKVKGCH